MINRYDQVKDKSFDATGVLVDVIISIYKPDVNYLRHQISSIISQTHSNLRLLLVSDGYSVPWKQILDGIDDKRIKIIEEQRNVGVLHAFIRAVRFVRNTNQPSADYIAYSDQDDIWHPEKLSTQLKVLESTKSDLCHCDARLIDKDGVLIGHTMFGDANARVIGSLPALLIQNSVTGMTIVFSSRIAAAVVTPPPTSWIGDLELYHDWWTAIIASAGSGVVFEASPLVDYRQHGSNVVGVTLRSRGTRFPSLKLKQLHDILSGVEKRFLHRRSVAQHLLELHDQGVFILGLDAKRYLQRRYVARGDVGFGFVLDAYRFHCYHEGVYRGASLRLAIGKIVWILKLMGRSLTRLNA